MLDEREDYAKLNLVRPPAASSNAATRCSHTQHTQCTLATIFTSLLLYSLIKSPAASIHAGLSSWLDQKSHALVLAGPAHPHAPTNGKQTQPTVF